MKRTVFLLVVIFLSGCGDDQRLAALRVEQRLAAKDLSALSELSLDAKNPWAAFELGRAYHLGIGKFDLAEAMYAYSMAAELPAAWFNAGLVYAQHRLPGLAPAPGATEPENACFLPSAKSPMEKAVDCLRQASDDPRLTMARALLGDIYREGRGGLVPNAALACQWYAHAAEEHDAYARYRLGDCYLSGDGMTQDTKAGLHAYVEAAKSGQVRAIKALAQYYAAAGDPEARAFWLTILAMVSKDANPHALAGLTSTVSNRVKSAANGWFAAHQPAMATSHPSDFGYLPLGIADF